MQKSVFLFLLASLAGFSVSGCSNMMTDNDAQPEPAEPAAAEKSAEVQAITATESEIEVDYAEFEPETLYLLMAAEIAAQRGHYDVTLANYSEAARQSRDPGVIERAMKIAQSLNANNAQRQLASLWLEVDPDSLQAHRAAAIQNVKQNKLPAALGHMEQILDRGGDADFDSLAALGASLPEPDREKLLKLYRELEERHPNNQEIQYSIALLLKITGDPEAALDKLEPLLKETPEFQPALVLKGDLLYQIGKEKEALNHLLRNTRRYPDNRQMGTLYGRMLISEDELRAAQDEFDRLMQRFPDAPGLQLSHALVALENGETETAREDLAQLIEQGQRTDDAHYYLGRIEDQAGNVDAAITHYEQVEKGQHFLPALARLSTLKAKTGRLEEARQTLQTLRENNPGEAQSLWLLEVNLLLDANNPEEALNVANEALKAYPGNARILYARAMLLDSRGELEAAERDLRTIIELQPDNAVALNALGYILATRTERLDEARNLIEKALRIEPENPAILDSMGWVLFQQGEIDQALTYLRRAYEDFPDPEVAAHLGEALWVNGQRDQAKMIWRESMDSHDDIEVIQETIERLDVESSE
ncbi:MAG: tetratricopeptide repeat protein [Oleiphilaceae bacterium]|nr:tetratricopeptide repeat protein [Oleiphilaceae bacterium]